MRCVAVKYIYDDVHGANHDCFRRLIRSIVRVNGQCTEYIISDVVTN